MPGTIADGHDFVARAFEKGAAAALVSSPVEGVHVLVDDVPRRSKHWPSHRGRG